MVRDVAVGEMVEQDLGGFIAPFSGCEEEWGLLLETQQRLLGLSSEILLANTILSSMPNAMQLGGRDSNHLSSGEVLLLLVPTLLSHVLILILKKEPNE